MAVLLGFPLRAAVGQWAPSLTAHDPNPPLTLEGTPAPAAPVGWIAPAPLRAAQFFLLSDTPVVITPLPAGEASVSGITRTPGRTPGWVYGPLFGTTPATLPVGQMAATRPPGAHTAPPQVTFWRDASSPAANPIFGASLTFPGRVPTNLPVEVSAALGVGLPLQFALPLPVVGLTPLPGRSVPPRLVGTAASPGLTILSPFLEDAPVVTPSQTRPGVGAWRHVDVQGAGLSLTVVPPEYPAGVQSLVLPLRRTLAVAVSETFWWLAPPPPEYPAGAQSTSLPARRAAAAPVTESVWWMPPPVDLPAGARAVLVPLRVIVRGREVAYTPLPIFGEPPPPGEILLAVLRPARGTVFPAPPENRLVLAATATPPLPAPGQPRARTSPRRAPSSTLTWLGYMPAPATVMPPGQSRGPVVPRPGRAAPVTPYLAAYILTVPPTPFTGAEMWQFPDSPTVYTFGGSDGTVWVFASAPTVWEW